MNTKVSTRVIEVLSRREVEIIKLITQEYSNEDIATYLAISKRTVETHRKNIFKKTKVKSVVGLVMLAIKSKLISA
ncbi:response regulator transcription factor [Pedobacter sp. UC225_61]|uniref:response regulator transcription factor n=1 Tax=Pedobacter sp. UC225_61 TaxID=3374623 RepID=UPI0037B45B5E